MVQKSYKRENIIGFADVDYQERLRPFRVFELLEDISDAHANILEIGAQSPVMEGYVWVVARNRYRLTRMPRLGEKITFETWPGQCQRAIYPRLFSMTDESGCRIGGVHSI
ncbi:MAG: acyl-ACP thioesterase domain-containing protein [Christensenellales bacterium]